MVPFAIVLVTDRRGLSAKVARLMGPGWANVAVTAEWNVPQVAGADLVLVDVPPEDARALDRALAVASRLRESSTPVLVADGRLPKDERIALYRAGALGCISLDGDAEELAAQLGSFLRTCRAAPEAPARLREHAHHLDEELRLAQRLQRDFLPRRMPKVEGATFAARLEAAAWVAGDFYDVFRLDERHVGFYIADAVGHGIPAALLTVFVKKSLQTKRIDGKHYELIGPGEALRLLNADLLSAELRETPFITMFYAIYNEATRELVYARAGHPKPILLKPGADLEPLEADGPLLGIFPDATFQTATRRLDPGDRVVVYSDGAERVEDGRVPRPEQFFRLIRASALLPVEAMLDAVLEGVHRAARGGPLADDVTLVALALEPRADHR